MKILFVHNSLTSFVRQDLECLRQAHEVTELHLTSRRLNPAAIWGQVTKHEVVFGWFASWHTFLPLLFARCLGRPSALVIGGYDLANMPSIGYGHQRGGLKKWVSRATMALANALITNSRYSEREAKENAGLSGRRLHVIYHGLPDPFGERIRKEALGGRQAMAVTVGNVDRANLHRKGLEPFVRAAALLPHVKFVVAGAWKDDAIKQLCSVATPNVEFAGWVDDATLQAMYLRASVYVQASRHEGFGMAVAEAMLAGCIPVVTEDGALPEVAGDCGIYSTVEPKSIALAILKAISLNEDSRARARQRVLSNFALSKRSALLAEVISEISPETTPDGAASIG